MSSKKVFVFVLVAFAAGWFAKGYFSTAQADELNGGESKEEEAED